MNLDEHGVLWSLCYFLDSWRFWLTVAIGEVRRNPSRSTLLIPFAFPAGLGDTYSIVALERTPICFTLFCYSELLISTPPAAPNPYLDLTHSLDLKSVLVTSDSTPRSIAPLRFTERHVNNRACHVADYKKQNEVNFN